MVTTHKIYDLPIGESTFLYHLKVAMGAQSVPLWSPLCSSEGHESRRKPRVQGRGRGFESLFLHRRVMSPQCWIKLAPLSPRAGVRAYPQRDHVELGQDRVGRVGSGRQADYVAGWPRFEPHTEPSAGDQAMPYMPNGILVSLFGSTGCWGVEGTEPHPTVRSELKSLDRVCRAD